ncbi:MAG: TIGR02646 family protein [Deltaproteobacteria bacterium]|nr:MAG: TIGR02646 family protein [Deltaproteobacteria bacterium]
MRYIRKSGEPDSLKAYKSLESEDWQPSYRELDKDDLRRSLLEEQGHLCCYCMRRIRAGLSRIEHFLPQHMFKEEELNCSNLFLACSVSEGLPPSQQHCDIIKGDKLIPKYILHPCCSAYFRYNLDGEILPFGSHTSIKSCARNFDRLNAEQKTVFATIELLNLNTERLKSQRKSIIYEIIKRLDRVEKERIEQEIQKYENKDNDGKFKRFCEVVLYFLNERLRTLNE